MVAKKKSRRRFWIKIPANFFDQGHMLLLERTENYLRLQNIWMRLLTFCLKGNPEEEEAGILRLSEKFPYDEKTLAAALRVDLFDFRVAYKTFLDFEMIEIGPDETIFVDAVQGLIGSETDSAARQRSRRDRNKQIAEASVTLSHKCSDLSRQEEKRSDSGSTTPQLGGDPESDNEELETVIRSLEDQTRRLKGRRA